MNSNDSLNIDDQHQVQVQLQAQILLIPNLLNPLSIEEFIEPIDEQIVDNKSDILDIVIESYT